MAPAPTPPVPAKGHTDPIAWVKTHPGPAAIAGGAVLGLVVLTRARSAKSSSAGASTPYIVPQMNTTGQDLANTVQPEIDALARQIQNVQQPGAQLPAGNPSSPAPTAVPPPPTPGSLIGLDGPTLLQTAGGISYFDGSRIWNGIGIDQVHQLQAGGAPLQYVQQSWLDKARALVGG